MIPVSYTTWDRLKSRVTNLGNPRYDYTNYETGAWGISVTCAISFLVYVSQTPRPHLAVSLYAAAAVLTAGLALVIRRFQKIESKIRKQDADDIVEEMVSIEEAFERGGGSQT